MRSFRLDDFTGNSSQSPVYYAKLDQALTAIDCSIPLMVKKASA